MREFISLSDYLFKYIFICCLLGVFVIAFGQDANEKLPFYPTEIHPTPNVSNLNGFIDFPTNLSTGGVNISIPIYNIQQNDLNVPISIDYNINNVTVNATSSNVGLGWSLNAGGVISRITNGIADEAPFIGFMTTQNKLHHMYNGSKSDLELALLEEEARKNFLDLQSDSFYFSGPFGGGKFAYDQVSEKFIQTPISNYIIEFEIVGSIIDNWLITDENGIKYYYGLTEKSKEEMVRVIAQGNSIPENLNNPYHYTSWYLSKIENKNGEQILFEYDNSQSFNGFLKNITQSPVSRSFSKRNDSYFTIIEQSEVYLKKITFNNGYIQFNLSEEFREDFKNSKKLESIEVYENNIGLIKRYELNQDYFNSNRSYTGRKFGLPESNFTKRLKLNSIKNINIIDNSTIEKYEFNYNNLRLPPKFSNDQDFWGRYNCAGNSSLLPSFYIDGIQVGDRANRSVNDSCAKASTLESIIFPTGGVTKYIFEPNIASSFDVVDEFQIVREDNLNVSITNWGAGQCDQFLSNFTCDFSMPPTNNASQVIINFVANNFDYECIGIEDPPIGGPGNGGGDGPQPPQQIEPCKYVHNGFYDLNGNQLNFNELEPGENYHSKYKYVGYQPIDNSTFFHNIKFDYVDISNALNGQNLTVGGLRIKEIKTFDNNSLTINKTYNYDKEEGISSGYTFLPSIIKRGLNPTIFSEDISKGISGKQTYYSQVVETQQNVLENSKISKSYSFYAMPNENAYNPEVNIIFPISNGLPDTYMEGNHYKTVNNDFMKSNIENVWFYKDNGFVLEKKNVFDINNHIDNRYSFPAGMYCVSLPFENSVGTFPNDDFFSCYLHYNFTSFFRNKSQTIIEVFNENEVVTEQEYLYSDNNPILVESIKTTNSLGETLKTEYKYPQDLTSNYEQSSMMQELVDRNIISTPVITKTSNDGIVTSEQRTLYNNYIGNILPSSIYAKKGEMNANVDLDDRKITYDLYDPKGNLMQYTTENGTPVSIVWGYNGQYPIAKVEGKNYGSISTLANNLISKSNNNNLSANDFESLRTLNDAIVTGYIYKPLVGVTKIIHPNGQQEIYEYDEAGRLEMIKDHNGDVLKEIEYNYQNQP